MVKPSERIKSVPGWEGLSDHDKREVLAFLDRLERKWPLSPKILEACARAGHEANRAYCIALGDSSQPPWENAPEWQRASAQDGVRGVLVAGNGPQESHEAWMRMKAADGWTWGPEKLPERKEHPAFLPYEELPEAQRKKDDLFVGVVRLVADVLGYKGHP